MGGGREKLRRTLGLQFYCVQTPPSANSAGRCVRKGLCDALHDSDANCLHGRQGLRPCPGVRQERHGRTGALKT